MAILKPTKTEKQSGIYSRRPKGGGTGRIYMRVKVAGKWKSEPTPYYDGDELRAFAFRAKTQADIDRRENAGELTLAGWVERWLITRYAEQDAGKRTTVKREDRRLQMYVMPILGALPVADIGVADVKRLIDALADQAGPVGLNHRREPHAPRSIHVIWQALQCALNGAVDANLIDANPCALVRSGTLPTIEDADVGFRDNAQFHVQEVIQLLTDRRISFQRRALYALKALTGARHGEVAALRWRDWDRSTPILGQMQLVKSYAAEVKREKLPKAKRRRRVPVHPVLAALLTAWRDVGWAATYGRTPNPEDLIVPVKRVRTTKNAAAGALHYYPANQSQFELKEDLAMLGLRVEVGLHRSRAGHDLRSFWLSYGQESGAILSILIETTHSRASIAGIVGNIAGVAGGRVVSGYLRSRWGILCREVLRMRFGALGAAVPWPEIPDEEGDPDMLRLATRSETPHDFT